MKRSTQIYNQSLLLVIVFLFASVFFVHATENDASRYAQNSVLSQGSWYKIKIPSTGVYKLTYDDLLKMGLKNPQNVQVYGYGGWELDENFNKPYIDDLPQVTIWMSSESPSTFKKGDYILFYARGDIKWQYDDQIKEFVQTQNPYSFDNYYFVTESENGSLLMEKQPSLTGSSEYITTFNDYFLHELEEMNVAQTGKIFYGESFTEKKNRDFKLPLEGIVEGSSSIIHYDFIAKAPLSSPILKLTLNGELIQTKIIPTITDYYIAAANISEAISTTNLKEDNTLNIDYTRGSSSDYNARLNYIRVNYDRYLKPYGSVTLFRSNKISSNLGFNISESNSSIVVFDVTDNIKVHQIETSLSGNTLSFNASNESIREYALVDLSKDIPTPEIVEKVYNQNLHGRNFADMIIIVQPTLQKYAEELAEIHSKDSGLKSLIVNPDKIYNEFSSGKPDVTAYRRFVKMLYDRAVTEDEKPKYLLLFGGGTFDNRFIESKYWSDTDKKVMLLTYQSEQSLMEIDSYVTDDYMGFLSDSSGANLASDKLDISIGRLPVRSEQEAVDVVAKIKQYIADGDLGIWESNITFVADDAVAGDNSSLLEKRHMSESELLANYVESTYPEFYVSKIYEDMYERVKSSGKDKEPLYPDATFALLEKIKAGTLVLNFVGHGSTTSWTHEYLLQETDIKAMVNTKLPLWITATCDFSRFDAINRSGGEEALANPNGGAIALFSTVRVVLMANNKILNDNIIRHLFEKQEGKPARLGDIIRQAKSEKNLEGDINKLKFLLLGDPALRLTYPDDAYKVEITELNGIETDANDEIHIRALDEVVIKGQVVDKAGNIASDFKGTLESIIFDAVQELRTRGNTASSTNDNIGQNYLDYPNRLFAGKTEIKDGTFEIRFVVSKDIIDNGAKGKMVFFAYDSDKKNKAQGDFLDYTVGGINPNPNPENNPPVISKLYLNKETFRSGDIVDNRPVLYAEVSDDTGINLSGYEHGISMLLDGVEEFDLSPYFTYDLNSSTAGSIQYYMPLLADGKHTLELKVWDVWNNMTKDTISFIVSDNESRVYDTFEIWGNPARSETKFVFTADKPEADVNIKIYVYSLTGQLVWLHEERGGADNRNQYVYTWYLNGSSGGRVMPGVYICTAYVSIDGKPELKKSLKLLISGN